MEYTVVCSNLFRPISSSVAEYGQFTYCSSDYKEHTATSQPCGGPHTFSLTQLHTCNLRAGSPDGWSIRIYIGSRRCESFSAYISQDCRVLPIYMPQLRVWNTYSEQLAIQWDLYSLAHASTHCFLFGPTAQRDRVHEKRPGGYGFQPYLAYICYAFRVLLIYMLQLRQWSTYYSQPAMQWALYFLLHAIALSLSPDLQSLPYDSPSSCNVAHIARMS